VQIIIALVVTPEGLPLAYECCPATRRQDRRCGVFSSGSSGNTARARPGLADGPRRADQEVLAEMHAADPPVHYLVGTPRAA